jgi:protein-tyrosine phosphatase
MTSPRLMNNKADNIPPEDTYWVVPGKLLAGPYPGSRWFEGEAHTKLRSLLDKGVNHFINLTQEGELVPYDSLLDELAGGYDTAVIHTRFPIADMHTAPAKRINQILDEIDAALALDEVVYVHCWGGIGRTGMIVGCYLVRHGMTGLDALEAIQHLRADVYSSWMRSPETDEQCLVVLGWKQGA